MCYHDNPQIRFWKTVTRVSSSFHQCYTIPSCPLGPIRRKISLILLLRFASLKREDWRKRPPSPWNDCNQRKNPCQNAGVSVLLWSIVLTLLSSFSCLFFYNMIGVVTNPETCFTIWGTPPLQLYKCSQWLTLEGCCFTWRRVWNLTRNSSSPALCFYLYTNQDT